MPTQRPRTPDAHVPDDAELLALVAQRPGLSLRELAGRVWPDLPWASSRRGADSATTQVRQWQVSPRPGETGNRVQEATAAAWLVERMEALRKSGQVRHGPRRRDEVDALVGDGEDAQIFAG